MAIEPVNADHRSMAVELASMLNLEHPPIAISFVDAPPAGVKKFAGSVPSSCTFWVNAFHDSFYTEAKDHFNCSIGAVTHGFKAPSEVTPDKAEDCRLMCEAGWLAPSDLNHIPQIGKKAPYVAYAPLHAAAFEPDIIMIMCQAEQAMLMADTVPAQMQGKPTCAQLPIAMNQGKYTLGIGCAASRVRTGMKSGEVTFTIPANRFGEFIGQLRQRVDANRKVAVVAAG
jgi:uncharacterized protein (DUF169 family)